MQHSIGIIGGADGPTAIFITGSPAGFLLAAAALVGLILLAVWFFRKRKS